MTEPRIGSLSPEELEANCLWHPFTQMRSWAASDPLFIASGQGVWLRDVAGREYLDANSSLWVNVHGHRHPALDAALREQIDRIAHSTFLGLTHEPAVRLAAELLEVAPPGLTRVFYSDSGSEAVEVALKMAFQFWRHHGERRRTRFLALEQSYHGDTIGAVSVGGIRLFHGIFRDLLFQVDFVPTPSVVGLDQSLTGLDRLLQAHRGEVSALILEPRVQAAAGMLLQPDGFLPEVRRLCDAHEVLLIADEVATGFGRTGKLFAVEHDALRPDLMCVAKGLTGGYLPLSATLATEQIYRAFLGEPDEYRTFYHGHSYTANPLGCAVARANLRVFREERVMERVQPLIAWLQARLAGLREHPHVREIRQLGLMVGIELADGAGVPYPPGRLFGARACRKARDHGVITRPLGDVVILVPPLCSSESELDAMVAGIVAGIDEAACEL